MKISVITATFNSADTIADTMNSVARQNFRDIEHIVIDGGSTDSTLDIVRGLVRGPCKIVSEPDRGIYDALNKGVRLATGDIVGFLHSDDFFADDSALSSVSDAFANADIDAVYADLDYVSYQDSTRIVRRWRSSFPREFDFRLGWMPPHPTLYVQREAMLKYGLFDSELGIAADYDSILRLLWVHKLRSLYLKKVLIKMRVGGISNRNLGSILLKSKEDLKVIRRNKVGGYLTLVCKNLRKLPQFVGG